MEILLKNLWILLVVGTVGNALILKYRSNKYIQSNPELKEGYDKFFKGILFYGNIPWVIIGIGQLAGLTQDIFEYFEPRDMNPIVLVFHAAMVVLWILSVRWIYFKGGAEFMERHPGLLRKSAFTSDTVTAKQVKLFFPLMLAGGIVAMVMMWVVDLSTLGM